jgi:predicted alpha/beta hydrolase family esterase
MTEKKQVFVVHGGMAWPSYKEYFAYLEQYPLERIMQKSGKRWKDLLSDVLGGDYEVIAPKMPAYQNAKYAEWKIWFEKYLPILRDDLVLVGHSMGGIFLVKYLIENDLPVRIAQLHLVAAPIEDTDAEKLCDFGFDDVTQISTIQDKVHEIIIYHSEDDPVVPFKDAVAYAHYLPDAELVRFLDRGHFLDENFPELVERL